MMQPQDYAILGVLAGVAVSLYAAKYFAQRKKKRISQRAKRGEKGARRFLEQQGYVILDDQVQHTVVLEMDGNTVESIVRADMLAKKNGRIYVVEVKTGQQANPRLPLVRRQMLEYDLLFKPHAVLFVDMENKRIHTVRFLHHQKTWQTRFTYGLIGLLIGLLIGFSML